MQAYISKAYEIWAKAVTGGRRKWRWIGYGFTLFAFLYLGLLILYSREQIQQFPWKVYWIPFLLSLLIYPLSLMIQYLVWSRLVAHHHRISWHDLAIYLRVLLIRRLPGGVWHWVDRTAMYTGTTDVSGRIVMMANFLEWSLLLIVAGAIGVAGWQDISIWIRVLLSGVLLCLAMYLAYSWLPKQRSKLIRLMESGMWLALYTLAWMAGGLILYWFSAATQAGLANPNNYQNVSFLQCVWTWALSGGSSQLMVFIPAGLGIREITLTWLLQDYMPISSILLVAILIRLTYAIADVLWGSLGMALSISLFKDDPVEKPVVEH